jgi:D-alanyl-D-alanine carboxypeptidase (penicillin-binding protein 5/6)
LLIWISIAAVLLVCIMPSSAFASVRSSDLLDGRRPADVGFPTKAMPDVTMEAGALITSDGRVLWARDPKAKRAIASLTKLMTAVVAIENSKPNEQVTIGRDSVQVGESTSFLRVGQKLTMSELLEALLVKSGNDAGVAIAHHVGGGEDRFVALMNAKARTLGLKNTRFTNPHGLDEDGLRSTAEDLAILSRYAMTKPEFRRIVALPSARIGSGAGSSKVVSTNLLLGNYAGANGVKTGFTSDAGYCVIGSAERAEIELYAIVLGTGTELRRFREATELLDFGFAHYRPQRLVTAGTVIGEAPVFDYIERGVPAAVSEDLTGTVLDYAGPITRSVRMASVKAPIAIGDRVGVATFSQAGQVVATVSLVSTEDVKRPNILQRIGIAIVRVWLRATGAL